MPEEARDFDAEQIDRILGSNTNIIVGVLEQLLSLTGALDAQSQNLAARSDPTIPALLNSQLQRFADQQNTGGFDANAFLSGDFSAAAPSNPTTFGAGSGSPFDIPIQEAGGVNPIVQQLLDNIGAQSFDSTQGILDFLFRVGGPDFNFKGEDQRLDPQTDVAQGGNIGDLQTIIDQILNGGGAGAPAAASLPVSGGAAVPSPPPPIQSQPLQAPQNIPGAGLAPPSPVDNLLAQVFPPTAAQDPRAGATTPILGRFAHGGTVPQTGAFILEQGEQVLPNTGANPPGGVRGFAFGQPTKFTVPAPADAPPTAEPGQGGPAPLPAPIPAPVAPPVAPNPLDPGGAAAGQPNPLQQAIDTLLGLVQGGGPITSDIANTQQTRINDVFANQLQSVQRGNAESLGARGLGGSGIQEQLGLQAQLGVLNNATNASNDFALNQALQNFGGVQGASQGLGALSLGAGEFGLQQQNQQFLQNQSMFEQLIRAIQGSFANPGQNPVTTVDVL